MPDASALALFTVAAITLLVIPGPSVLYIVSRSVDQGRAAGLASVGGIHVGTLVHVAAAALGLSALLVSSATAYNAVRWLGAAYLVWLGVRRLLAHDEPSRSAKNPHTSRLGLRRVFAQGVVVNVLNPKTALFFFAFLPQFVDVGEGAVAAQIAALGVTFVLLGLVSDGTYALVAGTLSQRLRGNAGVLRVQRYVSGTVFFSLGLATALASRKPS